MSFSTSIILNEKLKVTPEIGVNNFVINQNYSIVALGIEEVVSINNPCIVDYLEWSTNSLNSVRLKLRQKINGVNVGLTYPKNDGSGAQESLTPDRINTHLPGFVEILAYDVDNNFYKFRITGDVFKFFPEGMQIEFQNAGASTFNAAIMVVGRNL